MQMLKETRKKIPIFMYHSIGSIKRGEGLRSLHVSPLLFNIQLFIMKILGYKGLDMDRLYPYLKGRKTGKVFGITFDDGYENNYIKALPILKKYNFYATCYIVANNISGENYWDINKGYVSKKMMNFDQIEQWIKSGMSIGSHSLTHLRLADLDSQIAENEITASKKKLEQNFGVKIEHFCYPYGSKNIDIESIVKRAKYKTAVTVERGLANVNKEFFSLPRVFITHRTYPHLLILKILSNYESSRKKR